MYRQRGEAYEKALLTTLRQQFEQQRTEILQNASTAVLHGYPERKPTKKEKKDYLGALLLFGIYTDLMRKALAPILYALLVETGKDAMGQVDLDPSQFNPTDVQVLNYSQHQAQKIATEVNDETEKQLRASLGQGIDDGEDDNHLQARIEEVFGAALTYRAHRITRTEVTRAQGFADIAAWKQSGRVSGKAWYTAEDEKVCAFCAHLDGVIVQLDSNYFSLGDVYEVDGQKLNINYEAVGSPPVHPNCRCYLQPVLL